MPGRHATSILWTSDSEWRRPYAKNARNGRQKHPIFTRISWKFLGILEVQNHSLGCTITKPFSLQYLFFQIKYGLARVHCQSLQNAKLSQQEVSWRPFNFCLSSSPNFCICHHTFLTGPPTPKFCLTMPYMFKHRKTTVRGHQCVVLAQNNRETSELSISLCHHL